MIDYSLRYGYAETLQLPYPHRVYFDSGADEWNDCPLKQKLLDLEIHRLHSFPFLPNIRILYHIVHPMDHICKQLLLEHLPAHN